MKITGAAYRASRRRVRRHFVGRRDRLLRKSYEGLGCTACLALTICGGAGGRCSGTAEPRRSRTGNDRRSAGALGSGPPLRSRRISCTTFRRCLAPNMSSCATRACQAVASPTSSAVRALASCADGSCARGRWIQTSAAPGTSISIATAFGRADRSRQRLHLGNSQKRTKIAQASRHHALKSSALTSRGALEPAQARNWLVAVLSCDQQWAASGESGRQPAYAKDSTSLIRRGSSRC